MNKFRMHRFKSYLLISFKIDSDGDKLNATITNSSTKTGFIENYLSTIYNNTWFKVVE